MKNINITVGVVIPTPIHELMLSAACAYYHLTKSELFSNKLKGEPARKRGIVYYLTKWECNKTDTEIALLYSVKRQSVGQLIAKVEFEVNNDVSLQNTCDCNAIKKIFADLLKEQNQWLTKISP